DLPQEPGAAGNKLTDVDAGGRPGRQRADHRDLVDRRLDDLFTGLLDGDQRSANILHGRQLGEVAQHVIQDVQAVAEGDREQVRPVCLVEHVGVGPAYDIARDR